MFLHLFLRCSLILVLHQIHQASLQVVLLAIHHHVRRQFPGATHLRDQHTRQAATRQVTLFQTLLTFQPDSQILYHQDDPLTTLADNLVRCHPGNLG